MNGNYSIGGGAPADSGAGGATYKVGGTVNGLGVATGLVLRLMPNGGAASELPISIDGAFMFQQGLATGTNFIVMVFQQPVGVGCTVAPSQGVVGSSDVTNISVDCK
jgi:hypothetical protein